jgi:hypothetical protein
LPETAEYIKQRKQKCIYIGAIHPSFEGAEKIEYHSELEISILERVHQMKMKNPQFENEFSRFIETTKSERNLTVEYK